MLGLINLFKAIAGRVRELGPERLQAAAPDKQPLQKRLEQIVVAGVASNFAEQHAPDGTPWAPLKDPEHPWPHKPLVLTGEMQAEALKAAGNLVLGPGGYIVQMDLPFYSPFQQFGTKRIPPRPFMGIGEAQGQQIADEIGATAIDYLVGGLFAGETIVLDDLATQVEVTP